MSNIKQTVIEYLQNVKSTRSQNTYAAYENALKRYFEAASDLTEGDYVKFLKSLKHHSPTTQQQYRSAVTGLFIFADVNINFKRLNRIYGKRGGKRLPIVDTEAIRKVVDYCSHLHGGLLELRDRAFILLLADSGFRIGEACALKRGDIDRNNARAVIIGKGNKQAIVRISNRTLSAIDDYLSARSKLDGASGKPLASLPLFARHDKGAGKKIKPVSTAGMWSAIKERVAQAGEDRDTIRPHDFRHYFVTVMYIITRDPKAVKEAARHEDESTTGRYTHLLDDEIDKAYDEAFNHAV